MSDIATWLRGISLEKYAPVFEANEIDLDAARHLTEADLIEIGLPLGPRRKILATLQGRAPSTPDRTASAGSESAERRHITALFSDIVGSTELSGRLDPEAMSEVLRAYQDAVSAELRKFGGHLAKFMGDGVLAYFGWPQASEDAAERALRAGLGIVEAVARIKSPDGQPLRTRVGIASGLVVVGGRVGSGSAQEDAIAGDTLNLAARLQALAMPDCVLISEGTHQRVGSLFDCDPKANTA
jgi:class 3 adenylate cyclase